MAWFAVYRISDGALLSVGQTVANPLPAGVAAVEFDRVATEGKDWNTATLAFDLVRPKADSLSAQEFLLRFTLAERLALRAMAKTDATVEDILAMISIAEQVTRTNPAIVQALTVLANKGILTAGRATAIGDF